MESRGGGKSDFMVPVPMLSLSVVNKKLSVVVLGCFLLRER